MPLHYDGEVHITKINMGPYNNNGYILTCPETNEGIIVDTPAEPEKLLAAVGDVKITSILITHKHQDHLLGFDEITGAIQAPVGIGLNDTDGLPRNADLALKDGDVIKFGNRELRILDTPGHTEGGVCFLIGNHLFSGDTLFPGGPRQDPEPRGAAAGHRQHHPQTSGPTRRNRRLSRTRPRHEHCRGEAGLPGLCFPFSPPGAMRRRVLARFLTTFGSPPIN